MASLNTADRQYWTEVLNLYSMGYSVPHISAKMEAKTGKRWEPERVRSVLRNAKNSPDNAGIPELGNVITGDILKGEKKILVISDLHAPHTHPAADKIVEEHKDWDGLFVNGDTLDFDYVSSHSGDKDIPLAMECQFMHPRLKRWGSYFGRKWISDANHEYRWDRYLTSRIDGSLHFMVKNVRPLAGILGGFTAKDLAGPRDNPVIKDVEYEPLQGWEYTDWWFSRVGDCVIAHPSAFRKRTLGTVEEVDAFFRDWGVGHRCTVVAHTHKAGSVWSDSFPKRRLIESGCLCLTMPYQIRTGRVNYRPQSVGYAEVYLYNGECDVERTRQVQVC